MRFDIESGDGVLPEGFQIGSLKAKLKRLHRPQCYTSFMQAPQVLQAKLQNLLMLLNDTLPFPCRSSTKKFKACWVMLPSAAISAPHSCSQVFKDFKILVAPFLSFRIALVTISLIIYALSPSGIFLVAQYCLLCP